MAKKSRRARKDPVTVPTPSPVSRRHWVLVACYLGVGALLGCAIVGYRHNWFVTSSHAAVETAGMIKLNTAKPSGPAPAGMVWVPGGTFWMGSEQFPDAKPVHKVTVDGFWMDQTEVTNAQFQQFVDATGYVTIAEQKPDLPQLPKAERDTLEPFSIVFAAPEKPVDPNAGDTNPLQWWKAVKGADWRHPEGRASNIKERQNHPAVHIAYDDAVAYAKWAKKRLPTEAEWEFAARGGLDRQRFCWGDDARPSGKCMANTWQGTFPNLNTVEDGFKTTAPAASFPANGFGLHDMAGNVWEWCADWYQPNYYSYSQSQNPQGPPASFDPAEPGVPKRVQRGGSFLCAENYCMRYLPGARGKGEPASPANHIGFRCVR